MAKSGISGKGLALRFIAAVTLVFATYNPEGYSYYAWAIQEPIAAWLNQQPLDFSVLKAFAGVVLLIGWTIFLRATIRSLGIFGLTLAVAFFGTLLWLVVDLGWVPANSIRAVSYLVLFAMCGVLAAGVSWSHIRRRITGQVDVDEIEED